MSTKELGLGPFGNDLELPGAQGRATIARMTASTVDTVYSAILPAPFGAIGARLLGARLAGLDFLAPGTAPLPPATPLLEHLAAELDAYYADPTHPFDLALAPSGSAYRLRVWQALREIPAGQTRTYGELARQLGSGARAVGQALGDNPLPILIPCHRVIAADGGLGGFNHAGNGYSIEVKRWLLKHEGML